ncbi:MAG: hypothetical protein ABR968_06595 [Bacteroidales bacterium]
MSTPIKIEPPEGFSKEKLQEIEDHKKLAIQLREAAQFHLEAANQIKRNDYVQAFQSIISAYGILSLAKDSQKYFLDSILNGQIGL